MTKDITEIYAHLNRNFLLKPYLYEVRILGGTTVEDASQDVMLNCSQVNTPGTNIIFSQFRKWAIGNIHNMPMGKSFTELNLTFYESEYEKEREYFVKWQEKIFNKSSLRFAFFKDYVKNVHIIQYDKKRNKTYECIVKDVFPSNVSPLDKGYANEGIGQFNVNMQFYTVEELYFDKDKGFNPFA